MRRIRSIPLVICSSVSLLTLFGCSSGEPSGTPQVLSAALHPDCDKYVATDALGNGTGSFTDPFTLPEALASGSVAAGTTLCLRGGRYGTGGDLTFDSAVSDVVVQPYPGEHAFIDGGLRILGSDFELRDVEIGNSQAGARPPAVSVEGSRITLFGNRIHDGGSAGVYLQNASEDVSLIGNLIYANGFGHSGRGVRGRSDQLTLRGNVVTGNAEQALDLSSTPAALVHRNAFFGRVRAYGGQLELVATENLVEGTTQFGYPSVKSQSLAASGNTLFSPGSSELWVGNFDEQSLTGNRIVDLSTNLLTYVQTQGAPTTETWANNAYEYSGASANPFTQPGVATYNFTTWTATGRDAGSTFGLPTSALSVKVESLEPGRATVWVAAFAGQTSFELDVSALGLGSEYEIWNAKNPCGDAPLLGRTGTGPVHVPLTGWTDPSAVAGTPAASTQHAFVVTSGRAGDFCGTCDHYAAPVAAQGADGTRARPWSLESVLGSTSFGVIPGATICALEGTYVASTAPLEAFVVTLAGSPGAPVRVRSYPGHHVALDGGLWVQSSHIHFSDLEIYVSDWQRVVSGTPPGAPKGFRMERAGPAVTDVRLVNSRVHDTAGGTYSQTATTATELYGNLIYNNGWDDELDTRGHGHGIYGQSDDGEQFAVGNVIFNNFGAGIDMYGRGHHSGHRVDGNTVYEVGSAIKVRVERKDGITFLVTDIRVAGNLAYGGTFSFGGEDVEGVVDFDQLELRDNYFVDSAAALEVLGWRHPIVQGNTFQTLIIDKVVFWSWNLPEQQQGAPPVFHPEQWFNNKWYRPVRTGNDFARQNNVSAHYSWQVWQGMGFDQEPPGTNPPGSLESEFHDDASLTGMKVFARPNAYKPLSGTLTVFNHDSAANVSVDLAEFGFTPGRRYVIRNAFDPCSTSGLNIQSGVYTGAPITISLQKELGGQTQYSVAAPLCYAGSSPHGHEIQEHPLPDFGVFLVQPDEPGYCGATPPTCTL